MWTGSLWLNGHIFFFWALSAWLCLQSFSSSNSLHLLGWWGGFSSTFGGGTKLDPFRLKSSYMEWVSSTQSCISSWKELDWRFGVAHTQIDRHSLLIYSKCSKRTEFPCITGICPGTPEAICPQSAFPKVECSLENHKHISVSPPTSVNYPTPPLPPNETSKVYV